MIKFVADSSCDMIKSEDFTPVPLTISTDERTFVDDENLNISEMLDYLAAYKGRSFTACPSTQAWLEAFEGGNEIYVATMTSVLSGTYNSALVAKGLYLESHPDAKIMILDSLSTGSVLRMDMHKIMEWKKAGMSFEEIEEIAKEYNSGNRLLFAFKSLHNFAQNGRVSKVVASAVGVLGISIFGAAIDGNIAPLSKCRGDKKVISLFLQDMEENGLNNGKVYISHIENEELAIKIKEAVKGKFPNSKPEIFECKGLCSYYGERYGIILGYEKN